MALSAGTESILHLHICGGTNDLVKEQQKANKTNKGKELLNKYCYTVATLSVSEDNQPAYGVLYEEEFH